MEETERQLLLSSQLRSALPDPASVSVSELHPPAFASRRHTLSSAPLQRCSVSSACYNIMLCIILNAGYIYRFLQITHVIDMLCVIRHSHLLASLSDYVTLMTYMIVFHLKVISNMKCLLPFQGNLCSYLLSITGGILHGVSVSEHQLSTVSFSQPRGKAEFGPERLGGHPRHHGSFKTFLPWATWAPGAVRLLHWHRGDSQWVNVFIPIQTALYLIRSEGLSAIPCRVTEFPAHGCLKVLPLN